MAEPRRSSVAVSKKEIGVSDTLNLNFKLLDTIKILVSLFSSDTNQHLPRQKAWPDQIFFFAFDQIEGRQELFESDADWRRFFAKLSELYNTLPNVFITFTMTLGLRNRLYPKMEQQFRERISRDKKFVLQSIDAQEILAMYRCRLEQWRKNRLPEELEALANSPESRYLPFDPDGILKQANQKSLRGMLDAFDLQFRLYMDEQVVVAADARVDYLVAANEIRANAKPFQSTAEMQRHLQTVQKLLERSREKITDSFGLTVSDLELTEDEQSGLSALKIEVTSEAANGLWVRTYLSALPLRFRNLLPAAARLLFNRERSRNFLFLVRTGKFDLEGDLQKRESQVSKVQLDLKTDVAFQALHKLLDKLDGISEEAGLTEADKDRYRTNVDQIVAEEIKLTYLGELFHQASEALENLGDGEDRDPD